MAGGAVGLADGFPEVLRILRRAAEVDAFGGKIDRATSPELSKELAANIPDAKLEIIKAAGHLSNLDQPEIFNRLIGKFLAEIE